MTPVIRRARTEHIPAMVRLLETLFSIETDFAFDAARQRRGLEALLDRDDACVLVALIGSEVAGMCTLQSLISTAEGGAVGLIEDLIVSERHRSRGIGRALVADMEDRARERGLTRLQLLADRANARALSFYGNVGWKGTKLVALRKNLA